MAVPGVVGGIGEGAVPVRHHARVLTDGVITLREPVAGDVPAIVAAAQDPDIPRWTTVPSPYTEAHAREWIALTGEDRFVVVDEDDRVLGAVGLMHPQDPEAEIGYWLAAPARGRGAATRAVRLVRDWAAETYGARNVVLLIHEDNAASRRVAERAGFADTGEKRPCPRGCRPDDPDHRVYRWTAA